MKHYGSFSIGSMTPEKVLEAMGSFPSFELPVYRFGISLQFGSGYDPKRSRAEARELAEEERVIPFSRAVFALTTGGNFVFDRLEEIATAKPMIPVNGFKLRGGRFQEIAVYTDEDHTGIGYSRLIEELVPEALDKGYHLTAGRIVTPILRPVLKGFFCPMELTSTNMSGSIYSGLFGLGKEGERQLEIHQEWLNNHKSWS